MKPRKPIDRRPKCKECRDRFVPFFQNSDQKYCMKKDECIKAQADYSEQKRWKQKKKDMEEKLKTHSVWSCELQDLINEIARLIDKGQPCISCQKSTGSQRHGGHRWRTSTYPEIRFHLDNVASQCAYCNDYLSGNPDGYDYGLREFYGYLYYDWVKNGLKEIYKATKITIPELIAAKARAKKIVRELKSIDMQYPPKMRIELRNKFNKRLGIYK